jgi:hypothetical protein
VLGQPSPEAGAHRLGDLRVDAAILKKEIFGVLGRIGFHREGKSYRRHQDGATILVEMQKGFGRQHFINVGFWIDAMGTLATDKIELCHLYFRLERLVPEHRDVILAAGALGESDQEEGLQRLSSLLAEEIDEKLRKLGTDNGLRAAYKAAALQAGLLRQEARSYLATGRLEQT